MVFKEPNLMLTNGPWKFKKTGSDTAQKFRSSEHI